MAPLTPKTADVERPDASCYLLCGFLAIDDEAYRALPSDAVANWHVKDGAIVPFSNNA